MRESVSANEVSSYRVRRRYFCGAEAPLAVVAVPARNEADHIALCLQALAARADTVGIVVLLNNCTDCSFEVALAAAEALQLAVRIYDVDMVLGSSNAGGARRAAMDLAAEWLEEADNPGRLLLTTDADSRPPPDWLAANRAAIAKGVDAVAGRIELDQDDARALPDALHARGRLEAEYETLVTEMLSRLDPRRHDPWPRHAAEPGASLAVTLDAYRAIGGLPSMPLGEDRALIAALERDGFRVRHDPAVWVVTSGRTIGRAEGASLTPSARDVINQMRPAIPIWSRQRTRSFVAYGAADFAGFMPGR